MSGAKIGVARVAVIRAVIVTSRSFVNVLVQRAAQRDIELLDAPANGKNWNSTRDRFPDQWQSCRVSREIMQIGSATFTATVVRGMHIACAAWHQQTVDTVEQRQLDLPERRYQHRMRVRAVTQRFSV